MKCSTFISKLNLFSTIDVVLVRDKEILRNLASMCQLKISSRLSFCARYRINFKKTRANECVYAYKRVSVCFRYRHHEHRRFRRCDIYLQRKALLRTRENSHIKRVCVYVFIFNHIHAHTQSQAHTRIRSEKAFSL